MPQFQSLIWNEGWLWDSENNCGQYNFLALNLNLKP